MQSGTRIVEQFNQQQSQYVAVIGEDDEAWLQQVAANIELPPQLPPRRSIISDDGQEVDESEHGQLVLHEPLPEPPLPPDPSRLSAKGATLDQQSSRERSPSRERKRKYHYWQYIPAIYVGTKIYEQVPALKEKWKSSRVQKNPAIDNEADFTEPVDQKESVQETKEVNSILHGLNLSAMNNKVVGLSKDSQKLLESFTQVLKDIVDGVPTAYGDLERLITDRENQLDSMFNALPPFLQTLVKSLPDKLLKTMGPEFAATAAAASGLSSKKSTSGKSQTPSIPNLKSFVTEKAAVAAMLRSILNFLRLRFPAILAPNVLISLAVCLLLFVFWYCHKRGREERLKREGEKPPSQSSDSS